MEVRVLILRGEDKEVQLVRQSLSSLLETGDWALVDFITAHALDEGAARNVYFMTASALLRNLGYLKEGLLKLVVVQGRFYRFSEMSFIRQLCRSFSEKVDILDIHLDKNVDVISSLFPIYVDAHQHRDLTKLLRILLEK